MIVVHPRIYTLGGGWEPVEALRVLEGRVVFAGGKAEALALRERGEAVWEPEGACVMPGLVDTHAHLTGINMRFHAVEVSDESTPGEIAAAVAEAAGGMVSGSWITGRAWNQTVWDGAAVTGLRLSSDGFPAHDLLTRAAPNHPVVLHRTDQHAVWVNQAAMDAAGIDAQTPDPDGGRIVRDVDGAPMGVFVDEAASLISAALPPLNEGERRALLRCNAVRFLRHGVTTVHCAMIKPGELEDYARSLGRGAERVPLRVRGMVYDEPATLAAWALEHAPWQVEGGWWSVETLKTFADGALGSKGAWFYEPYEGSPVTRGFPVASPQEIESVARAALHHGWQMATHAIGPRAIAETVEAYARAGWHNGRQERWRIEHVQHPRFETLDRMAQLGLYGAIQPIHATRDMRFVRGLIGPEREATSYPWRAVMERGIPVGFGSDYPIETLDPFAGMHASVTRQDEHGAPLGGWHKRWSVTALEAALAYGRLGAGLIASDDGHLGHLGVGARADMIVLPIDLPNAPPQSWLDTKPLEVMVDGQTVDFAAH